MAITDSSCAEFVKVLASSAPTPGGGGAAALVGAVGTALGAMVGSLTLGKKKYAGVEQELLALQSKCTLLQAQLLSMVEKDAACFAPLAAAYRLSKDDPARADTLENATALACTAPMEIMELCCQALDCIAVYAEKGSRLAVSDAGCGAVCCKAALQSAALNVYINTKALQNTEKANALNDRADALLRRGCAAADKIYEEVYRSFREEGKDG